MKRNKLVSAFLALIVSMVFVVASAQAATNTTDPTAVVTNTSSLTTSAIGTIMLQEVGNTTLADGYFTIKIPSDVQLAQTGSTTGSAGDAITRSTTILGTSTTPKSLYVLGRADSSIIGISENGSFKGILRVFKSSVTPNFLVFGSPAVGNYAQLADWSFNSSSVYPPTSGTSGSKVGQIYLDASTNETVITLAGRDYITTASEKIQLVGLYLKPTTQNATGTVNLSILNGNAAGSNGIGITDDTGVKVMTLVNQAASITGTASTSTVPQLNAGAVAAQPMGKLQVTMVGDAAATTASTLTFALNNGAKFHNNANDPTSIGGTDYITLSGLTTTEVDGAEFSTDSSGNLVLTVASGESAGWDDQEYFYFEADAPLIDASAVTTAGTITCTVTGTGIFSTVSASVAVATAATAGVTISFVDDTTAGFTTLYTGRNSQELGTNEYVLVGEDAPTSLLAGGSITMALNNGAKFQTSATVTFADTSYTTSPYTNGSFAVSDDASTAAATSMSISVETASSGSRGAFTAFKGNTNWLDLRSMTAGDLTVEFGGTAGASGTVTIASVINATTTTALTTPTIVPGTTVTLPDIQIVEGKAAALATGYIGIKFPSSFTLDNSVTPTVTATDAGGTSSTTAVTYNSMSVSDDVVWLQVVTPSVSTGGGLYTIVVSGIQATIASTAGTADTTFTVGGATSASYTASTFNGNTGAMPTAETVTFASVVSATLPFADTATVAGTMVTQTFIAAGNDIGKVGDLYVFTGDNQYYDGSTWSTTEGAYSSGATLGTHTITYDTDGLVTGTSVFIGYGVGLSGTAATMSSNGTFVNAYTTPSTTTVGTDAGAGTAEQNVNDAIELYLNITNDDNYDPAADFVYEWLVFGATVGGADAGLFFYTNDPNAASAVVAYDASLDLTTVAYTFDHTSDTFKVSDLNMGTLGLSAGDQFWYGYVYGLTGFDLADTTTWSLENYTFITAK